jgi:hypothetical protein
MMEKMRPGNLKDRQALERLKREENKKVWLSDQGQAKLGLYIILG